jgi:hypothetical protein
MFAADLQGAHAASRWNLRAITQSRVQTQPWDRACLLVWTVSQMARRNGATFGVAMGRLWLADKRAREAHRLSCG